MSQSLLINQRDSRENTSEKKIRGINAVLLIGTIYLACSSDDSVDGILWWDHFYNNDSTVLLRDSICFKVFKNNLILFFLQF